MKDSGVWKIKRLNYNMLWQADYEPGWAKSGVHLPPLTKTFPEDPRGPDELLPKCRIPGRTRAWCRSTTRTRSRASAGNQSTASADDLAVRVEHLHLAEIQLAHAGFDLRKIADDHPGERIRVHQLLRGGR